MPLTILHYSIDTIVLPIILLIKMITRRNKQKGTAYERVYRQISKKERSVLS